MGGIFGIVLLIVCVNVANLSLSRSERRLTEIAVRIALGATRGRVIRQLMTESVLLGALAGLAGTVVAAAGRQLLFSALGLTGAPGLGWRSLGFVVVISLLTGVVFGLAPAFRASSWSRSPS